MAIGAIPEQTLIEMYRVMVRIRLFEEMCLKEFSAGKIPGWVHPYIGEEPIATGVCAHLRNDDYISEFPPRSWSHNR